MEPMEAFPEREWDNYSRIFSMEEPHFLAEVLGLCSFPLENYEGSQSPSAPVLYSNPATNEANKNVFNCGNTFNPNSQMTSQENTDKKFCSTTVHIPASFHNSHFSSDFDGANNASVSMDLSILEEESPALFSHLFTGISMGATANIDDPHTSNAEKSTSDYTLPAACAAANGIELKRKCHTREPKTNSSNNSKKRTRIASDVKKNKKC